MFFSSYNRVFICPLLLFVCTAIVQCVSRKISTLFVKQGTSGNSDIPISCVSESTGVDQIGFRIDAISGNCFIVGVSDYKSNGPQAGYKYFLKSIHNEWSSPGVNAWEKNVPGIVTLGTYFEFHIRAAGLKGFTIQLANLDDIDPDILLLLKSEPGHDVLINSYLNSTYGPSLYKLNPFTEDRVYIVRCTITGNYIQVDIDGSPYYNFSHRSPFSRIDHVDVFSTKSDSASTVEHGSFYFPL